MNLSKLLRSWSRSGVLIFSWLLLCSFLEPLLLERGYNQPCTMGKKSENKRVELFSEPLRALHLTGNWGLNRTGVLTPPDEYFEFLHSLEVNWIGISVALHITDSMDSTVERTYSNIDGATFPDDILIQTIRKLREHGINVYLTLALEDTYSNQALHPVQRWQLGDPNMPNEDHTILPEYWPWSLNHPLHKQFVKKFWQTYTEQAVHFARIAEAEDVSLYSLGTETERLFRTRSGGRWPNDFGKQLKEMVDSVRSVYHGPVTYDMVYQALTANDFYGPGSNFLWHDLSLDVVGISAYFPLVEKIPTTVVIQDSLEKCWERIFLDYLLPLKNQNPDLPIIFLEFGYADVIVSPCEPWQYAFKNKVFQDKNLNGQDDGEEQQANIYASFFYMNHQFKGLIEGAFLWGHEIATDEQWSAAYRQFHTIAVRQRLAEHVVRKWYEKLSQPLAVLSPNGGEQLLSGEKLKVKWVNTVPIETVRFEYSVDNGKTWKQVDDSLANTGIFDWTIPDLTSRSCLARILSMDRLISDVSDSVFSIWQSPAIVVTQPRDGEIWYAKSTRTIEWSSTANARRFNIGLSLDGGNTFIPLRENLAHVGSFDFQVPDIESSKGVVRVIDNEDSTCVGASGGFFRIIKLHGTVVVNTMVDKIAPMEPTVTLREAISFANGSRSPSHSELSSVLCSPGKIQPDTIVFDPFVFPSDHRVTIYIFPEPLPSLSSGKDIIDASDGDIVLDGRNLSGWANGLIIASDSNQVKGLSILNFPANGIFINGCANIIGGNRLYGNGAIGEGNVLSSNKESGVALGEIAKGNIIRGNLIGTDRTGAQVFEKIQSSGIYVAPGAEHNIVGGLTAGERNVLSGNDRAGVNIRANGNLVFGNLIGTDITGRQTLGRQRFGIWLELGASENKIGDKLAAGWNVICGSSESGIIVYDSASKSNIVAGNWIGTNSHLDYLGNAASGIFFGGGASNIHIGTQDSAATNVIAFNRWGVSCQGGKSQFLKRNAIFSNREDGIVVSDQAEVHIENCTIVNNMRTGVNIFSSDVWINSTILWNNVDEIAGQAPRGVEYSAIEDGDSLGSHGNINSNPQFVNQRENNLRLTLSSICIDSGDPILPLDPDSSRADMGAYHFYHEMTFISAKTLYMPKEFRLHQNYPNPFNAETIIRYELPQKSSVKLGLYNLSGQEIAREVDTEQDAGSYLLRWDGRDQKGLMVASGIYLVQFEAGVFLQVKKAVLVR